MNILLINHYAGTPALGMEYRPYYLAREWVRQGHRVQVLAANYSHVRTVQPPAGEQVLDGIHYRWLPTPAYQGNGVGRLCNITRFLRQVRALGDTLVNDFKPHAVIASSTYPLDVRVARRIARRAGAKLVYEVHDLWPLSMIELSGMSKWHPFALLCQWAEDAAYRDADVVVSMLPKVHAHMAGRGLDLKKLHIVPNGISPEDWATAPPLSPNLRDDVQQALQQARSVGDTVVGYAGSMGLPNALDTLLDAAKLMPDAPVCFVLVGDGHERARLRRRIQQEGLHRVQWFPAIPKAQVPTFLAGVDIATLSWQRVPIYRFGIAPNKLMDYMMAARPVLHAVEAGNDPVAEAGCGITVAPESASAIVDGLRQLLALTSAERAQMGERGRAFVLAHHTYPVLAQCFIDALDVTA
jgi:glycosyltransferase involved in cell wall biosynthesis